MALPSFTMRQLLEAGVHFGHHTRRWNPKMAPFLFGVSNKIHIIDLQQTVPMLHRAMQAIRDVAASGGRILFVGTKRQSSRPIAEAAARCGQYYVNHRWLGGMLTNWKTVSVSIRRLRELDELLAGDDVGFTKKELLKIERERDKLDRSLGGIRKLGSLPDILFVIDTVKETIAVQEANKLGIPVAAVIDSNSDPDIIAYPIPGNDDSIRAVGLYCSLFADSVLDGLQEAQAIPSEDLDVMEALPPEETPTETVVGETSVAPKETAPEAPLQGLIIAATADKQSVKPSEEKLEKKKTAAPKASEAKSLVKKADSKEARDEAKAKVKAKVKAKAPAGKISAKKAPVKKVESKVKSSAKQSEKDNKKVASGKATEKKAATVKKKEDKL